MKKYKAHMYAVLAFLAAWQGANFKWDYRAVLGAIVAAGLGAASPNTTTNTGPLLRD